MYGMYYRDPLSSTQNVTTETFSIKFVKFETKLSTQRRAISHTTNVKEPQAGTANCRNRRSEIVCTSQLAYRSREHASFLCYVFAYTTDNWIHGRDYTSLLEVMNRTQ